MKYEKCHILSNLKQKGRNSSDKKHFLQQNSVKQSQEDVQYDVSVSRAKAILKIFTVQIDFNRFLICQNEGFLLLLLNPTKKI